MKTLQQVLDAKTAALQEVVNDMYPNHPDCRYVCVGEGTFEMWASVAGDALQALHQKGELGTDLWPQLVDHYAPEMLRDGQWEYLDILGPVLYVGQVYDRNTHKLTHYLYSFSYSEYGCEFGSKVQVTLP